MMDTRPLALVVQRYGAEIVGGSETLCRSVAEMLTPQRPVEVLTTCARDYMTWRNVYPAGEATLHGVRVRRFPVDFERDQRFHSLIGTMLGGLSLAAYNQHKPLLRAELGRTTRSQQMDFLRLQGPYSTPLWDFLRTHHEDYAQIIFFTYLYATSFFGSQQVPAAKMVLVPTAHDEAPIFLPVYREMFARFPAHIFLTPEERQFVEETFPLAGAHKITIGMVVEHTSQPDANRFRARYGVEGPFLLYAGRIDPTKGCDRLLGFYRAARRDLPLPLILIGNQVMDLPRDPHIRYLGMLPEQDKLDAMAAATVLINPSPFESFSIVVLEAMLCGTPVLVNGRCEVLRGHVKRSRGGLYYTTGYEFVEALRLLLADEELRARMGANGAAYVRQNYARNVVCAAYQGFLEAQARSASDRPG
jgi:glycosyltransferase involved in cell wall biosynthesis